MIRIGRILIELLLCGAAAFFGRRFLQKKFNRLASFVFLVLCFCAAFLSASVSAGFQPKRTVTLTALNEKNPASSNTQVYLRGFTVNGAQQEAPEPIEGNWTRVNSLLCWYEPGNGKRSADTTERVTFALEIAPDTGVVLMGNKTKGLVRIEAEDWSETVDTYLDSANGVNLTQALPAPSAALALRAMAVPAAVFFASFLVFGAIAFGLVLLGRAAAVRLIANRRPNGLIEKYLRNQFLFEELVARDFKKKYKRTLLGVAWSILSPLLLLFVMRIVFMQFFGRSTPHYTIYLFCGTLLFSYFRESTNQGMTSLTGNAKIFTKVNVPKYLFLFSKNVQTLINFGLTLCVFFVFCIIDGITFTWKFVLLLYPILCIMVFNLGLGLILSALYVFFRDIQYLWQIFTQLLTYLSAIFYTIDRFSPTAQKLFLLNPMYVFIRYFRKIVIEGAIPSWQFHLLMTSNALVVLLIGCWMYRKYNTKFLYYV